MIRTSINDAKVIIYFNINNFRYRKMQIRLVFPVFCRIFASRKAKAWEAYIIYKPTSLLF